jgi:hypothetical protein
MGSGLVLLNNLGQLVAALGGAQGPAVYVSLFSIMNCAGRIAFGCAAGPDPGSACAAGDDAQHLKVGRQLRATWGHECGALWPQLRPHRRACPGTAALRWARLCK